MQWISKLGLAVTVACAAGPALSQDAQLGAELYRDYCAACHGPMGQGDGPMAAALTLQPSNLTNLAADGVFPVLRVVQRIDGRDPVLAHGGDMPLFGRWFEGQGADVAMSGPGGQPILMPAPMADLVAYLMELQS